MTVKVKICGLKTKEAVSAALLNGATYLGFIFHPGSPRYITPLEASKISQNANMAKVAVVVDATDKVLTDIVHFLNPHYIQLHGKETEARAIEIKKKFGLQLIRAVEPNNYPANNGLYDFLLVDSPNGGSGIQFDYTNFTPPPGEYFLSGGLNVDNLEAAIKATGAKMVDVSSGVESAPGAKDPAKIKAFLEKVKKLG